MCALRPVLLYTPCVEKAELELWKLKIVIRGRIICSTTVQMLNWYQYPKRRTVIVLIKFGCFKYRKRYFSFTLKNHFIGILICEIIISQSFGYCGRLLTFHYFSNSKVRSQFNKATKMLTGFESPMPKL